MLSVSLEGPNSVLSGSPVTFRLLVRNTSEQTVDLYLRGREPTADVVVSSERGDVVWHSLAGLVVPAVLQIRSLTPGDALDVSVVWDQRRANAPPPPGRYVVRASLLVEGEAIESSATFVIARSKE
jgi:intracellular proteinase inhibitor BsuPI